MHTMCHTLLANQQKIKLVYVKAKATQEMLYNIELQNRQKTLRGLTN